MLTNKTGRPRKYFFAEMSVGDEQFHAAGERSIVAHENLIIAAAAGQVGTYGKFKTKRVQKGGKLGVTIRRVSE
jgi:hypothetical protein